MIASRPSTRSLSPRSTRSPNSTMRARSPADRKRTFSAFPGRLVGTAAVADRSEEALAIGRAVKTVDRDIIYVALAGSAMEKAGRELGLPVAREGFCDRLYDDDGNLTSRKIPGAVLHDPEIVKERVVKMVLNEEIVSRNGKPLKVRLDTLCCHG